MKNIAFKSVVAAAALVGATGSAQAYLFLSATHGAASVSCQTNLVIVAGGNCSGFIGRAANNSFVFPVIGQTYDSLGAAGLDFGGTVGDFSLSIDYSANLPGTALSANFNKATTNVSRLTGNNLANGLFLEAWAVGFTLPAGLEKVFGGSTGFSTSDYVVGDSVTTVQKLNTNNAVNILGPGGGNSTTLTAINTGNSFSENKTFVDAVVSGFAAPNSAYSLGSQQAFSIAVGSTVNTTSNMTVRPIPEPGTAALAGLALLGAALSVRRSKKA